MSIDVATGKVMVFATDFVLPGFIPLEFKRVYKSVSSYNGPMGYGWMHNFDMHIIIDEDKSGKFILFKNEEGRNLVFDYVEPEDETKNPSENLTLRIVDTKVRNVNDGQNNEVSYFVLLNSNNGLYYEFRDIRGSSSLFNLVKIKDSFRNMIKLEYSNSNFLHRIIDSANRVLQFDYGSRSDDESKEKNSSAKGSKLLGIFLMLDASASNNAAKRLVSYSYSNAKAAGHNDTSTYLLSARDEIGYHVSYNYTNGLLTRVTDKNGYAYNYSYDADTRCIKGWGDDGSHTTSLQYDATNNRTWEINSVGKTTIYEYNAFGLIEKEETQTGVTSTEWDANLNKILFTDQFGNRTEWIYDDNNQLIKTIDPKKNIELYEYDEFGRLIKSTDQIGNISSVIFDDESNRVAHIDPLGRRRDIEQGFDQTHKGL